MPPSRTLRTRALRAVSITQSGPFCRTRLNRRPARRFLPEAHKPAGLAGARLSGHEADSEPGSLSFPVLEPEE